jgi:hypothetical protein
MKNPLEDESNRIPQRLSHKQKPYPPEKIPLICHCYTQDGIDAGIERDTCYGKYF